MNAPPNQRPWLATALFVAVAASCDHSAQPPELEDLNVLVLVVDTFGAEHAGSFLNPELDHTPHMDKLASRGVVFRKAYAPSPWTQPSVASLLTGTMPSRHGVKKVTDVLGAEPPTLAALLKERGFATGAVISNMLLHPRFGFARGFHSYQTRPALGKTTGITSEAVTNRAIKWIGERADKRFFFFAHYFDPHHAYHHHSEFDQTSSYGGSLEPSMSIWKVRDKRPELKREDIDYLIGLHREEIAYTDSHIGRLLDHLRSSGIEKSTLVILTADHGEEFMRHGWIGHTRTLYEELLHVPMIVSLPGVFSPAVVDDPVSLIDVMPTVLAMSSAPDSDAGVGLSLLPYLLGTGEPAAGRPMFGEVSVVPLHQKEERHREKIAFKTSLLSGSMKLIHDLPSDTWELYDVAADPEELRDLVSAGHSDLAHMESELRAWEKLRDAEAVQAGSTTLDSEAIERLRQLGYIK